MCSWSCAMRATTTGHRAGRGALFGDVGVGGGAAGFWRQARALTGRRQRPHPTEAAALLQRRAPARCSPQCSIGGGMQTSPSSPCTPTRPRSGPPPPPGLPNPAHPHPYPNCCSTSTYPALPSHMPPALHAPPPPAVQPATPPLPFPFPLPTLPSPAVPPASAVATAPDAAAAAVRTTSGRS